MVVDKIIPLRKWGNQPTEWCMAIKQKTSQKQFLKNRL